MALLREIRRRARHMVPQVVAVCLVAYFALHLVQGERGLLAFYRIQEDLDQARAIRAELEAQRQTLARRVALLRPDGLDPDMLEERARKVLNFARPDEVVILLKEQSEGGGRADH